MSEPQQPPVPPTDPNAPTTPSFPAESFPPAPPATSSLPADPQYPSAPQPGAPQPPFGQGAPFGQTAPQPSSAQPTPQYGAPQHPNAQQPPSAQPAPQYGGPQYGAPQQPNPQQPNPQQPNAPHPGAAPYSASQLGYTGAPSAPARPAAAGDQLGRTAFIVALAALGLSLILTLSGPFLWLSDVSSYSAYNVVSGFGNLLVLAAAATALVLGLLASRRPGSKLLPGIAIGIGGAQTVGIIFGWISSLFYAFF